MNRATLIPLLVTVILPLLWLIAEFRAQKTFRMALGIIAFSCSLVMIFLMSWFAKINTIQPIATDLHDLIQKTIAKLEDGDTEHVLTVLRNYNSDYSPVTQTQISYLKNISKTADIIDNKNIVIDIMENTGTFNKETWNGFWADSNNENGFLISSNYSNYDIYKKTIPPLSMGLVTVSEDFSKIQFQEKDIYRHTLVLKNKYIAEHKIVSIQPSDNPEKTEILFKYIPPQQIENH